MAKLFERGLEFQPAAADVAHRSVTSMLDVFRNAVPGFLDLAARSPSHARR